MKNKNIIVVQNLIRCLDMNSLKNPEVVANLVRAFGIVSWGPHSSGPEAAFITQREAGIAQTPDQIAKALVYLSTFKIDTFCEVGLMYGANFLFASEYLRRFNLSIRCLGIDPSDALDPEIRAMIEQDPLLEFRPVTSKEIAGQVFDFVFLDGDHSLPWVQADWQNIGQHAKLCAFHDLQDLQWPGVGQFWPTLQSLNRVMVEFLDDPSGCRTHGIGIIHGREIT